MDIKTSEIVVTEIRRKRARHFRKKHLAHRSSVDGLKNLSREMAIDESANLIWLDPELATELRPLSKKWHANVIDCFLKNSEIYCGRKSKGWAEENKVRPIRRMYRNALRKIACNGESLGYLQQNHPKALKTIMTEAFRRKLTTIPEACAYLLAF